MLPDTRVSITFTPGSEHRRHPGVKQVETGVLKTKSKYSRKISLLFLRNY